MPDNSPQKDLSDKLEFEDDLRPKLRSYNNRVVNEFRSEYAKDGSIIIMSDFDSQLSDILTGHYNSVTNTFRDRISPHLPEEIAITEDEESLLEESLIAWLSLSALDSSRRINATTQGDVLNSVRVAQADELTQGLTGRERQRTVAAIGSRNLKRKLVGRESGILMTETQIPAETAKATEAEVLSGVTPSIQGGTPLVEGPLKEWVSVGDSRVREDHLAADGQEVPMSQPFIVGGEALRWPGDRSLGASLGNIINCRCSSRVQTDEIINLRFARNV